jgi:hypothetical protein
LVPKINFEPPEPFGISITFSGDEVLIEARILSDEELVDEDREPLRKRIYAALATEPLSVIDLARITGAAEGSVHNTLSSLMREEPTRIGATAGRPKLYYRLENPPPEDQDFVTRKAAAKRDDKYNHHQDPLGNTDDDYISEGAQTGISGSKQAQAEEAELQETPATVAGVFANPPSWLPGQLKVYRQNPGLHFKPLCVAVAAAVFGDGLRWEEVREEVRKELDKETNGAL